MIDLVLAPARWLADRAWYALARRVLPAVDDNLVDIGGVPRQLVARHHGGHRGYGPTYVVFDEAATFDGKAIGERLDSDIAGCDR